jgi:ubiquinone/menaquinone biosynthesis C-methylase UbiE
MATMDRRTSGIAALFDRVADAYDGAGVPWFRPIAGRLVAEVGPRPGQRALDLGCGRGAALFALAEAVGPDGRVTGVDVSRAMADAARAGAAARGLTNVDIRLMDAGRPDLPGGAFDVAIASMMLFFLPDPVAALRSWRDLLAPGGRLGISTQGSRDPGWRLLDEIFLPYLPPVMVQARHGSIARRLATVEGVHGLLTEAGYGSIRTSTVDMEAVLDGVDHWREWTRSHAGRAMWDSVPEAELPRLLATAHEHLEGLRGDDGKIRLGQRILLTVAEPA